MLIHMRTTQPTTFLSEWPDEPTAPVGRERMADLLHALDRDIDLPAVPVAVHDDEITVRICVACGSDVRGSDHDCTAVRS